MHFGGCCQVALSRRAKCCMRCCSSSWATHPAVSKLASHHRASAGFVSIPHDFSLCSLKSQLQALLGRYGISAGDEFSLRRAFNSGSEWYAEDGGSDWGEVHGSGACSVCSCGEAEGVSEVNGSDDGSDWGGPGRSGCADGPGSIDGMWAAASSKLSSGLEQHLGVQAVQVDLSAEDDLRYFSLWAHTLLLQPEALSLAVQVRGIALRGMGAPADGQHLGQCCIAPVAACWNAGCLPPYRMTQPTAVDAHTHLCSACPPPRPNFRAATARSACSCTTMRPAPHLTFRHAAQCCGCVAPLLSMDVTPQGQAGGL